MTSRNRITIIITALAFSIASFGTLPQYTRADAPLERPWLRESIPYAQSSKPQLGPTGITQTSDHASDVRLVFASFRNGVWQVFQADGDGNTQTVATPFLASDRLSPPRLRYGGVRIILANAYAGSTNVATVYLDGSSNDPFIVNGTARMAVWSPNGRRVALSLRASPQSAWQVHVKDENSAFSPVSACLTCDLSGNHLDPTWSPNGSEIIWIRVAPGNTQTASLWRMSSSGQNKRQISGEMFFLSSPVWSHDGSRVAFDAAPNAQAWNRLYVMDAGSGMIAQVYDPNQNMVDAWMGSWTPDDSALLFSRIEYVAENAQLYLDHTYIERVLSTGGSPQRLTFTGRDLYPDVSLVDRKPPVSRFWQLPMAVTPAYSAWIDASDTGGSGLNGKISAQYRIGDTGTWQDVLPGTCWYGFNQYAHIGPCTHSQAGDKVYLRSRAYDRAGNVEDWPTSPDFDTFTTLYSRAIKGKVIDIRGLPIVGAAVTSSTPSVLPVLTEHSGEYAAYFAIESSQVLTPGKAGFGSALGVLDNLSAISPLHVLPPANNLIQNGDFEQDGAGWQFDPTQPAISYNRPHSGNKGANLDATLNITPSYPAPPTHFTMSQTITLPANLHQPTLSFLYQPISYLFNPGGDMFTVSLKDESTVTIVKAITDATGTSTLPQWRLAWVDLSQWAGKQVTITFDAILLPNSSISLDEISIGEWKTPVIATITPSQITAAGNNTVVISGTNFIGTPTVKLDAYALVNVTQQPDGTLTGDLPAQLPAGQYDVMVINPEGQSSVLTSAFQFGSRVLAPVMLRDVE